MLFQDKTEINPNQQASIKQYQAASSTKQQAVPSSLK